MNIIVGKNSGFCAGVRHTILKATEALEESDSITYCLGEIIHNEQVIESLEKKGLKTINSIQDANGKTIIRAHGVPKEVYTYSKNHNIELIDLTCPKVSKIHNQVQDFAKNSYFIFLFGIKNHPETIGTFSFCSENAYLIESPSDISDAICALVSSGLKDVLIISQTTFSVALFEKMVSEISSILGNDFNIHLENSICNATSLRQNEAKEISSKVDLMIIIGGKNSSNTKKLYEVSKENCDNVLMIQTKDDLDANFIRNFENIGIIAGASTPSDIIDDVVQFCKTMS